MSSLSRYRNDPITGKVRGRHYFKELDLKSYTTFEVTLGFENRIDLVAYECYGNCSLWWVIAEYNEIKDPFFLPLGTKLIIPSRESLYGYRGILS